jgi:hypothetical protein
VIAVEEEVKFSLPSPAVPRGKGTHVSGIIRAIATEMGLLKPSLAEEVGLVDVRNITDPDQILRMSIGMAWEEWYLPQVLAKEGVAKHPGETQVDGIYMTPDGESLDVVMTVKGPKKFIRIHEIKATYKSTKTVGDISGEWMWLTQMKAYCMAAQTRFAKLHVLFLCGDYSYPIKPKKKRWAIEFTEKEISDCWDLMTSYRDQRAK